MNKTNIITSLNVNTQLPLDYKTYVYNENTLLDLGLNQTKAFSYYVGMKVYCALQNKTYIWREYLTPLELNGLIPNGFIYPNGTLNTDYNYSNKKFNFFKYELPGIQLTGNISQFINDVGYLTSSSLPSEVLNHLSNTSNPHATTASQVGLGNVNNTSDLNKPISTATQNALDAKARNTDLDLKAPLASPTFTGVLTAPTIVKSGGTSSQYLMADGSTSTVSNIGNITMVTIYSTLEQCRSYLQGYTSDVITDESFSQGVYKFSVPRNSAITVNFMNDGSGVIEWNDPLGFFSSYGNSCFNSNTTSFTATIGDASFGSDCFSRNSTSFTATIGDATFGYTSFSVNFTSFTANIDDATFGDTCFSSNSASFTATIGDAIFGDSCFSGNVLCFKNTIKNILSAGLSCFRNYLGRLEITGNNGIIGATAGQDFTDCFVDASGLILILPTKTATINGGAPDGDIQIAIANGATVHYESYNTDTRQIHINASTTILKNWNGAIIIITTAGVVLTVPATLPANFTFDAITRPNATCNFALSGSKVWVNGTPTLVPEKSTFVFVVDSLNSNEIYLIK